MRPRRRRPWLALLPWGLACAVAAGSFAVLTRGTPAVEPAILTASGVEFTEAAALERRWIDEAFPVDYLPSPALELPCPTGTRAATPWSLRVAEALSLAERGEVDEAVSKLREMDRWDPSNWVPGLALGGVLLRAGRLEEAASFLEQATGRSLLRTRIRSAADAARRQRPHRGPLTEDVLGGVHLLHAYAYARLSVGRSGPDVFEALSGALAGARLLALRELDERDLEGPEWLELKLRAPGCRATAASLTPLDLTNDLIVAYLGAGEVEASAANWRQESQRDYREPPRENPLLAVLLRFADEPARATQGRAWALSEAERLLRTLSPSGDQGGKTLSPSGDQGGKTLSPSGDQGGKTLRGEPWGNARLAANLATLTRSLFLESPEEGRVHLRTLSDELLATAVAGRGEVSSRERSRLGRVLARLLLDAAVDSAAVPELPEDVAADLDPSAQEAARRVAAALGLRADADAFLGRLHGDVTEVRLELAGEATPWLRAGRRDVARSLARRGAEAPEDEQAWWARQARGVLAADDEAPDELLELEGPAGPGQPSGGDAAFVAFLAAAVAWIAGGWGALQLAAFADLRTSFYRLEARRRLRRG